MDGGINTGNVNYEKLQFYYHPDHLGSSSYITNLDGTVVQHVEYVPFGEVFIEERNNTWNTPYLFNGKELDEETGLYYYGARYFNPRETVWLSVDPLAEKFTGRSPYEYCFSNPINLIDPTGMGPNDPPPKASEEVKMWGIWADDEGTWDWNKDYEVWEGINGTNYDVEDDGTRLKRLPEVVFDDWQKLSPMEKVWRRLQNYLDLSIFGDSGSEEFYHVTGGAGLGSGDKNSFYRFGDTVRDVDFSEFGSIGRDRIPRSMDFLGDIFSLGSMGSIFKGPKVDYTSMDTVIHTKKYEIDSRGRVIDSTFKSFKTNKNVFHNKNAFRYNSDKWTNKITMDDIPDSSKIEIKKR